MDYENFIKQKENKTIYLGGGLQHTKIYTRTSKLVLEKRYIGNHTEIQTLAWKEIEPNWM